MRPPAMKVVKVTLNAINGGSIGCFVMHDGHLPGSDGNE